MGVQREPGQKGVSWSNIAVGTFTLLLALLVSALTQTCDRRDHEHGTIL